MRKLTLLILLVMLFDLLALHPLAASHRYEERTTAIALNTCPVSESGSADHDEVPCLTADACAMMPSLRTDPGDALRNVQVQTLFCTRSERPPAA